MLDEDNIMVRSGQHCVHSWFNAHNIPGCVRVSLYLYNTKEEAEKFLDKVAEIAKLG
jgi:cysteine desulfurase/selenocysteine lyase